MLIGIISDTHDKISGMEKALEIFKKNKVSLVLHCGDWITPNAVAFFHERCAALGLPLRGVWGNNDIVAAGLARQQELFGIKSGITNGVLELQIDGRRIAVCHGHEKELLKNTIENGNFDVVCTGHTHKAKVTKFGDCFVVNPGSTAFELPFNKHNILSVALYDTTASAVDIIELD